VPVTAIGSGNISARGAKTPRPPLASALEGAAGQKIPRLLLARTPRINPGSFSPAGEPQESCETGALITVVWSQPLQILPIKNLPVHFCQKAYVLVMGVPLECL
jgi:hypothetical protein